MLKSVIRNPGSRSIARVSGINTFKSTSVQPFAYYSTTGNPSPLEQGKDNNGNEMQFNTKGAPIVRGKNSTTTEYKLPKWKEALGEYVIKTFGLDMDKIRAGPVSGSYYYSICKEQGLQYENESLSDSAKFFYEELKLPRTFSQWFQITALHEWMLFVRMRAMPFKYGRNYQQKLVDKTFNDIEMRLFDEMKIVSGRIVDQYSKDFNSQLKGAVFAYDVGFYTDDTTLATAVWRNLFGGRKNIDYTHLEAVVKYIRSQLYVMSRMSDREFALGKFKFVPATEKINKLTVAEEKEMKEKIIKKYEELDKSGLLLPSDRSNLSYDN
ncbi:Cbp3p [Maudiozyma barnettii]|uniref:Similar to Saccharomyces cerevisiae YPL215W CBP3 Mitochondrial protein required for assembly of cytochrome bc1 complex n=1 Tax=Maudiozyma barnettii TaxID=61262 RepID=A0A8H2VHK6_9SACH|nr:Cbp3p [Kazachstania barnettii]CAB4255359.1 similar to Saccharomyces cerevisiae YPL215W CBP3 Mitochondrial protein required for assembly of cytochrome bc1 complex [Kazachstania barnettii]